jgi:hypothetical protein
MPRLFLVIATSTSVLACSALNAWGQEYPEYQMRVQPQIQQPQEQERQSQRFQSQRRVESDNEQNEDWYGRPMMRRDWRYHQDWLRGGAARGMMGAEGMRGAASMGSGMMMRMIFTLMEQ